MKKEKPFSASGAKMPREKISGIHEPDIEEKMKLFADGGSSGGGGGSPPNRPKVIKRQADPNRLPPPPARKEYHERPDLDLFKSGPGWKKLRPTNEALEARGLKKRGEGRDYTGSNNEEPSLAERIILEALDDQGFIRPKGKNPKWLGDGVIMYPGNKADDQEFGCDAIAMVTVPVLENGKEVGKKGYPLIMDMTTDPNAIGTKIDKDNSTLDKGRIKMDDAAWADLRMPKGQSRLRSPQEGLVYGNHVSIHIPTPWVEFFGNPSVGPQQADDRMARLKPYVLRQMQSLLEMQATIFSGFLPKYDMSGAKALAGFDRGVIEKALTTAVNGQNIDASEQAEHLLVLLRKLWEQTDALPPLDREQDELLPRKVKELGTLKRPEKKS